MSAMSLPVELGLVFTIFLFAVICRRYCLVGGAHDWHGDQVGWIGFTMNGRDHFFRALLFH